MLLVCNFTGWHGLPLHQGTGVQLATGVNADQTPRPPLIRCRVTGAHELAEWARAIGSTEVAVYTWANRSDTTALRADGIVDGFEFSIRADYGRRLGAKDDVVWAVDRNGKRQLNGLMTVEALAALPERERSAS